jgi:NADH-quinone oxidoreductase subunit C
MKEKEEQKMENEVIVEGLTSRFGTDILNLDETTDILTLTVSRNIIHDLIKCLKDDESFQFTFLTDLTGIHYPDKELQIGVIYHLHNLHFNKRIRIKTFVSAEDPVVRSMTDIFSSANWMERETFDFYGVVFDGHPNLRRILNVEYMDYFPMRKEYPLEDQTREDKDDRFFGR